MTRLSISRSRPFFKYFLFAVILFCLYLIIGNAFFGHSNDNNSGTIITAAIIGIIALFAAYNERYAPVIEFDDENMNCGYYRYNSIIRSIQRTLCTRD